MKESLPSAGTQIGRYVVDGALDDGGTVYEAHVADRRFVIRLFRTANEDERMKLVRAGEALVKLRHTNVVSVFETGLYADSVCQVAELVAGTSLRVWRQNAQRGWREILDVFLQAGRGLAAAHAVGVVHRDFKPDHVLVGDDGVVKVSGFGLARTTGLHIAEQATLARPGELDSAENAATVSMPRAGAVAGTRAYMAPEQAMGAPGDARTDQHSYCVALYRALYGEPPYAAPFEPNGRNLIQPPLRNTDVPSWLRPVLVRGLAIKPEQRYPTLDALLDALAADPAVRRRRLARYAGLVALLAVVIAIPVTMAHRRAALDPCYAPASHLAGVWDDAVKERMRDAFVATGVRDAPSIGAYAEKEMDRTSSAWLAAYVDACRAPRTGNDLQLRLACLDEQRIDLRAAAELMSHPDPQDLSSVIGAASTLSLPAECADARALGLVDPPPPANRERIEALRAIYGRGIALSGAGRDAEAIAVLEPIPDQAKALGARHLEVEALRDLALSYAWSQALGAAKKAAAAAQRGAEIAVAAHMDVEAAAALASVAYLGISIGRPAAEVDEALARARRALTHVPPGTAAEITVENAAVMVAQGEGRDVDALEAARRELKLARKVLGPNSGTTANSAVNVAFMLEPMGRYEEELDYYREAIASFDARLGPSNPRSLLVEEALAETYLDMNRLDDCDELVKRMLSRTNASTPEHDMASLYAFQASLLAARGKRAESLQFAERALTLVTKLRMFDSPSSTDTLDTILKAYVLAGEYPLAVSIYERLRVPPDTAASARWVDTLRNAGWAYLESGQPKKAIPLLERALKFDGTRPFYPGWMPRIKYQLGKALVLTKGNRKRAAMLIREAHDELVGVASMKGLLAEIDAYAAKTFP